MAQSNPTTTNAPTVTYLDENGNEITVSYGYGITQEQMVELVRTHHPEMLEKEIRVYLNQALREFTKKTKILRGVFQKAITEGVRWYQIDDEIVSINKVFFNGKAIQRNLTPPENEDLDV